MQGYNAQVAVDGYRQVITAHRLTTDGADYGALATLVEDTIGRCGRTPKEVSADAGFCNEDNLAALEARKITGYIMPGRARHNRPGDTGRRRIAPASRMATMEAKLKRRTTKPLPLAQADRRARLRSDQGGARLPSVPAAPLQQRHKRMGADLHRSQPK